MVQQDIPPAYFIEDHTSLRQPGYRLRRILNRLQVVESLQTVHLHQNSQVKGTINGIKILIFYAQFFLQDLQKPFVTPGRNFQPDSLSPLPLLQLLLYFLQQVRRLILLDGKIGISHNSKRISAHNVIIQEQLMHIPLYDLFQKNDLPFLSCHRKFHNTAEHTGYLYRGKFQFPPAFLLFHQSCYI